MIMTLDRGAPELLRDQLADLIRAKIASGEWPSRTAIPSVTALAAEYDVATDTVTRAIALLKAEELLFGVRGKGTFVS